MMQSPTLDTTSLQVFNKPYPFYDDFKYNAKLIFFIPLGVFLFLWLFQPFEIAMLPSREKYYLMVGIALITFLALSIYLLFIPSLMPGKFSSAVWNIKKEILYNVWILFTILAGYFFYAKWLVGMNLDFSTVIMFVLTAAIPITALIIVNHNKMLRTHVKLADEMNLKLKDNKRILEKIVHFKSEYQKDSLSIKISSLLLIRSANNYIEVFWIDGDAVRNQMVRCSMTNAEETIKEYKFVLKCHRSYIVNINYIDRIEGNSLGYKLFIENVNFDIPVAKGSVERLKQLI
jgi:hypothetical protein